VTPYTFTSTATSVLMNNGIPVFSDIDSAIYCLDPKKLESSITKKTRAIIAVHLFGQPCDITAIINIANKHGIKVIEDCAQSPGAEIKGVKTGTFGDCGIFSFQESKNMMTGEGGMLVTNDEDIAKIAQMVRNHGEVILQHEKNRKYRTEILGWGYRMTEIEAAIGIAQLERVDEMNDVRIELSEYLIKNITKIEGIEHNFVEDTKNVYYVTSFSFDEEKVGISRNDFVDALSAEGIPFRAGYLNLLYLSPLYQNRMAHAFDIYDGDVSYEKGICPTAESVQNEKLIMTLVCRPPATKTDMDDIINAFHKIVKNKNKFKK
jgi:dTDP-4-amino-4,6-dideoxygalactose transaminase